ELAQMYFAYWRRSMIKPSDRVMQNGNSSVPYLAGRPLYNDGDFDKVEEEIVTRARAHGFHAVLGVTAPFHELMLWRKQTVQDRQVHLPEGPYSVRVTLLDDFALRGWGFCATCGRRSTSYRGRLVCSGASIQEPRRRNFLGPLSSSRDSTFCGQAQF